MDTFQNRVVVVTGAAGQLGRAVARAFFASRARVTCVDRARDRLPEIYGQAAASSEIFLAAPVDVNDPGQVKEMVAETVRRFGRLDVLVHTVGGFRGGTPVHQTSLETWDFLMTLNARTAFITSQAVLPPMLDQGAGVILLIAARPGLAGRANIAAYSAAKSAVIRLTESLSAEYKEQGLRVNCLIPGTIDTPQNRSDRPNADPARWVTTESLAEVILFLASDAARDVHGAAFPVVGRS